MKKQNTLTPEQEQQARINFIRNRVMSGVNFGRIKTLYDYLLEIGHSAGELEYAYGSTQQLKETKLTHQKAQEELKKLEAQFKYRTITSSNNGATREFSDYEKELIGAGFNSRPTNGNPASSDCKLLQGPATRIEDSTPEYAEVELIDKKEPLKLRTTLSSTEIAPSWTPHEQHPKQKAKLWKKQEITASNIYHSIMVEHKQGALLNAGTGSGKTYVLGAILRRLIDNEWEPLKHSNSPWPIVYVTKASIVEQTKRVLEKQFGLSVNDVTVINVEQLRATFGDMFIKWETLVESGVEYIRPIWKNHIHPILFVWDECHILKNLDSQQSLIAQDVNNIEERYGHKIYQMFASATAGTRVIEFKCFAVSTRCRISDRNSITGFIQLTNRNWTSWAKSIANPSEPEEHSPAAIERLITHLLPYIYDIKGLRPQFHPINRVELIEFDTQKDKQSYDAAWEDYLAKKAELENSIALTAGESRMMILAKFTIFRKTAEYLRARILAKRMYRDVKEGYAAVSGCAFKTTIAKAIRILIDEYGIPRSKISIIWGGMDLGNKPSKKAQKAEKELQLKVKEGLTPEQIDQLTKNMILGGASMGEITEFIEMQEELAAPKPEIESKQGTKANTLISFTKEELDRYELGVQSKETRQREIDKFQSGQALYCFFTFKAGGVGLSLHHTDEMTKFKCRKHPNGDWVLVDDIPLVPTRPRRVYGTMVYSAIELVQFLGRCARLTSLSDTPQTILGFLNTIEVKVAHTVSIKLKCLKKVVRQKESWESIIMNPDKLTEDVQELPREVERRQLPEPLKAGEEPPDDPDDSVFLGSGDEDE